MNILLLEDDQILHEIIEEFLQSLNYNVISSYDGADAQELIYEYNFDLLLLDVNVPNTNGFKLLKELRNKDILTPAIFITSLNSNDDMNLGFNSGCDDYLKKPFELNELNLRINNIKRLCKIDSYGINKIDKNITYDYKKKSIINNDLVTILTKTESRVFEYLIKNGNRVVSIEEILLNNWTYDEMPSDTTIRTYIKNFRKIIGSEKIITVKGIGYRLDSE